MYKIIKGIPEDKSSLGLITYALCSDGIYLIKASGCGHIVTKVDGITDAPKGNESIGILPRKIPIAMFWETLKFFRYVEAHYKEDMLEAYVFIMYDTRLDKFRLVVPKQKINHGTVNYDLESVWEQYPGCKILMDIHSHTSKMSAHFSPVDDKDDNRDRFSGVIGKINNVIPEFAVRFSTLGKHYDLQASDVFVENNEEFFGFVQKEAIKNVSFVKSGIYSTISSKTSTFNGTGYSWLWNKVREKVNS